MERELLVRRPDSRILGEEELAFRHALLREGAYGTLTEEDRTLGHRLAGEWLEARGEPAARVLAEHFDKGGDGPGAGRYYLCASRQASRGGDGPGAISLARRGLALSIPNELRMRLLGAICETAAWYTGMASSMQSETAELLQSAPRGSAPWAQAAMAHFSIAMGTGQVKAILALVEELKQADVGSDGADPLTIALTLSAYAMDLMGRTREADALLSRLEVVARAFGDESALVALAYHGILSMRTGVNDDPFGALEHARKCKALARQSGHRRYEAIARLFEAMNTWCLGAAEEAERILRAPPTADGDLGLGSAYRPFVMSWLLADRGALAEARSHAEQLLPPGGARGLPLKEARGRWALAEVLRGAGDLDAADREVQAALAMLEQVCPLDVPGALATLSALRLAQGRPDDAVAAAAEGMRRYAAMGMCSQFFRGSYLRLVHVESLEASGRHAEARAALAEARTRLHAIAAQIREPAYRSSFLEGVPENRRTLALASERLADAS
ncbi:hypothetical protein WMF30_33300 [Sorangium sp. So ce134]